jgi:hypothetical protein
MTRAQLLELGLLHLRIFPPALFNIPGTITKFRQGAADAQTLEKEFYPELAAMDLTCLPNCNIYLKLIVQRTVSRPLFVHKSVLYERVSGKHKA